jgi:glycine cleavage system aminomethyltransferase T
MHERTGAILTDHHGWQIPTYFTGAQKEAEQISKTAGLSDLSWMTKLDLKGYGLKTQPAVASGRAWCLAPEHYLITCEPQRREAILANISCFQASHDLSLPPPVYVTDVTSVYAQFLLTGPRSREILRKLTSLNVPDLDNLGCRQANLAHVHCVVLREDLENMPAFHLLVSREYGESVWEAVMEAGNEFQLTRFGLAALKLLGGAG